MLITQPNMIYSHAMPRFLPSLSALAAFEAAAKYSSFTKAAEELNLTQSGVSRQVSALEDFLGVRLFDRFGPRLVLTAAGRSYSAALTTSLNDLEAATNDVVRGFKANYAMQIGVQAGLANQWFVSLMKKFLLQAPEIKVNIQAISQNADTDLAALDVAILRGHGSWQDMTSYHLMDETVIAVAAPELIDPNQSYKPADIERFTLIQSSHRPDMWKRWLRELGEHYQGEISGPRFSQTSMVISAALTGMGLALVPYIMVQEMIAQGRLVALIDLPVSIGYKYFVVHPENKSSSKDVLRFRNWLLRETQQLRRDVAPEPRKPT
ncbi:LysR substrate-binding domain-containing protein [Alloyangia pacifica]|uniref:DNA-binding transcriptional regulator, LysR family n=1 Tax=Alloyangia pacifica TaxID=311180 RepID=A0A1I6UUZ3_9RHOB|nr:LysR substrate-binding domain-containing protein [Alloyangia pacifica]SDI54420.1 DNA-binding transcriptional regulator, LysR family [Alloyangia pacifica]SFT05288.1 DNA-binding transcriptional regulator, LysR family [Alloyangia pacifica]